MDIGLSICLKYTLLHVSICLPLLYPFRFIGPKHFISGKANKVIFPLATNELRKLTNIIVHNALTIIALICEENGCVMVI